jgi:hypothetical protein
MQSQKTLKEIGENKNNKEVIEYLQGKKILHKTQGMI